jgi:hypothetical protein
MTFKIVKLRLHSLNGAGGPPERIECSQRTSTRGRLTLVGNPNVGKSVILWVLDGQICHCFELSGDDGRGLARVDAPGREGLPSHRHAGHEQPRAAIRRRARHARHTEPRAAGHSRPGRGCQESPPNAAPYHAARRTGASDGARPQLDGRSASTRHHGRQQGDRGVVRHTRRRDRGADTARGSPI